MLTGQTLLADIDEYQAADGQFAIWWLGQHGFVIKLRSAILYLDVYFSHHPDRQVPNLLEPGEVTHADVVLGTHDHGDHIDRESWPGLDNASSRATFVVPELLRESLAKDLGMPVGRFLGLTDGQSAEIHGVKITAVAAAHEFLDRDEQSGLYPYLGYVIEADGATIYHAGDTCIYEGLQARLRHWQCDLVLLPINGRDAKRLASGCVGNMTYQEAADLAGTLRPGLTVPTHYEMFAENSEDPQLFVDYMQIKYPNLKTHICQHGQHIIVGSAGAQGG